MLFLTFNLISQTLTNGLFDITKFGHYHISNLLSENKQKILFHGHYY